MKYVFLMTEKYSEVQFLFLKRLCAEKDSTREKYSFCNGYVLIRI